MSRILQQSKLQWVSIYFFEEALRVPGYPTDGDAAIAAEFAKQMRVLRLELRPCRRRGFAAANLFCNHGCGGDPDSHGLSIRYAF